MVRAGGKETENNALKSRHKKLSSSNPLNSPDNEEFDPTLGCPSNAEEWDIYWEWIGIKMDSTIIVTCLLEVNFQSVRVRLKTPSTEHPRNISSTFNKLTNTSATIDNSTSTTSTQLSPKEVAIGFIVVMVLIFFAVFFLITLFFTSERVNPEQIRQATETPVFPYVNSEFEDNNRIDTR